MQESGLVISSFFYVIQVALYRRGIPLLSLMILFVVSLFLSKFEDLQQSNQNDLLPALDWIGLDWIVSGLTMYHNY